MFIKVYIIRREDLQSLYSENVTSPFRILRSHAADESVFASQIGMLQTSDSAEFTTKSTSIISPLDFHDPSQIECSSAGSEFKASIDDTDDDNELEDTVLLLTKPVVSEFGNTAPVLTATNFKFKRNTSDGLEVVSSTVFEAKSRASTLQDALKRFGLIDGIE
jgi:hypothetical protein